MFRRFQPSPTVPDSAVMPVRLGLTAPHPNFIIQSRDGPSAMPAALAACTCKSRACCATYPPRFPSKLDNDRTKRLMSDMPSLHTTAGAVYLLQIFVSVFLAILFLQSGVDKIADRRGNLQWLTSHFAKSPLRNMVPLLLSMITALELAAGALSGVGFLALLVRRDTTLSFYGACIAAVAIISLFFGQRMAKDYAGAATLVPYFLLTLAAIYLLAL